MKLPSQWELPEQIKKRFGQKRSGKQRAMVAEGHLLLVLHKAPVHGTHAREGVFFWRNPEGKWESSVKGEGLHTLRKHVQVFELAEEKCDKELEQVQDAEDYFQILQKVGPLRHSAKNLHATLQAAREAIHEDRDIIDLRDQAYDLERELDLLYTDTKNSLDFHIARKTEEENQLSIKSIQTESRLNILAAIFFPLTAIASVFGMNLPSGLEKTPVVVFWLVFLAGIILGFFTCSWAVSRRPKENKEK